jgi:hypothetical protein
VTDPRFENRRPGKLAQNGKKTLIPFYFAKAVPRKSKSAGVTIPLDA